LLARPAAAALVTVALGVALAVPAPGYLERHGETPAFDVEFIRWIAAHPDFEDGRRPVAMAPRTIGLLAGDDLEHELEFIPADEPCDVVDGRRERGWVVVAKDRSAATSPDSPMRCLREDRPSYDDPHFSAYAPRSSP
jgi:hypothetical protein